MTTREEILRRMGERILVLDGATGTYLQRLALTEEDFRGERFGAHPVPLKGCNDVLCLTQPDIITRMHLDYIEAGADIIETNSFNANCFSLSDYGLEDRVYEISRAAAECARRAVESARASNGEGWGRVIIAGSMGPTNRTFSMSSDVNNPAQRDITFSQLCDTYRQQVSGLLDGGADVILVETIFDTLNAKAALKAVGDIASERGVDVPVMCSGTLSDASGRTLSGQTVEAFVASLSHGSLLSIGLNCGFGAKQLLPFVSRIAAIAPCAVSVHPNAGLPNVMGGYDETPETFAEAARRFLSDGDCGIVNIYGGCCGTTPAHIKALADVLRDFRPRAICREATGGKGEPQTTAECRLSGLEPLVLDGSLDFVNVGERTNVAGSAKFKRLIKEKQYDEALAIARHQVENGAHIIDICMDDGMIDGVEAMTTFLRLIAAEPEIARVPVMIDSSKWEILVAGLENVQGKAIVNSISLKEGEEAFLKKARHIRSMGAAAVVMLFDEQGQADTYERKIAVARRAYTLLKSIGFPTEDVIFDPNVLSVATGMAEHNDYGRAFIEACRTIRREMPEVHLSGGISNLSFSFRGNNVIRQAMHSVFLHHAMEAGLDMSIVNPAMTMPYGDIPQDLLRAVEDVVLNRDPEAAERLMAKAQEMAQQAEADAGGKADKARKSEGNGTLNPAQSPTSLKERIADAMLRGLTDSIADDTLAAYNESGSALAVIDGYLMPAMERVGELFGEGKMFLPQVVKSARVMKKAVAVLEPYMGNPTGGGSLGNTPAGDDTVPKATKGWGGVVMATVKGDVHDIGKNIVAVVTQCNGYEVVDLGVMVETETIVEAALKHHAAVIGLSGLITPSLEEMIRVCRELQRRGMTTPVIVGGATTSALHTAVKMAPEYPDGVVIHSHAAADNAAIIRRLTAADREEYIAEIKNQQRIIRENYLSQRNAASAKLSIDEARRRRHVKRVEETAVPTAEAMQPLDIDVRISEVKNLINWNMFFQAWGIKGTDREGEEGRRLMGDAQQMLREMEAQGTIRLAVMARILPAYSTDSDEIVITRDGEDFCLPMPRSLDDEPETRCLADYIAPKGTEDYVCPFVATAGIGLEELQNHYQAQGDDYRAMMAKLLCDRLAEALAEYTERRIGWGSTSIRMAFGYGACPDHTLKREVFRLLGVPQRLPLSLTETCMIAPGESICGLIFANTPTKYFNV